MDDAKFVLWGLLAVGGGAIFWLTNELLKRRCVGLGDDFKLWAVNYSL